MLIDSEELMKRVKRELPISGLPMPSVAVAIIGKIIRELEEETNERPTKETGNKVL